MGNRIEDWIENQLEKKLKLKINRAKTKVVKLREEGVTLNFLGYTFRFDRDLQGRGNKYLNFFPAKKSLEKMKEKIKKITSKTNQLLLTEAIDIEGDTSYSFLHTFNFFCSPSFFARFHVLLC